MSVDLWRSERRASRVGASTHLWAVVLAGTVAEPRGLPRHGPSRRRHAPRGRTHRLHDAVEQLTGLVPPERVVTVLARDDARTYDAELVGLPVRRVVQPLYRGSAAQVFHPVLKILHADPEAMVVVLPDDARLTYREQLVAQVARAASAVMTRPDLPLVIGAQPLAPDPASPWVEPGQAVDELEPFGVRAVTRFVHQPSPADLAVLYESDGLLNTQVIVARARILIALGARYVPDVLESLEPLEGAFGGAEERLMTEAVYEGMPSASLAHALFARPSHFGVLPAPHAVWRHAGRPALHALAS